MNGHIENMRPAASNDHGVFASDYARQIARTDRARRRALAVVRDGKISDSEAAVGLLRAAVEITVDGSADRLAKIQVLKRYLEELTQIYCAG